MHRLSYICIDGGQIGDSVRIVYFAYLCLYSSIRIAFFVYSIVFCIEVPWIRCTQGSVSREEVIWKLLTENDCNTLRSRSKERSDGHGCPR